MINAITYLPLLKQYCLQGGIELSQKCGYDQGPFIPYTFERYNHSKIKIFYVGIDTYYWVNINILQQAYASNNLDIYLASNESAMTRERIFDWRNKTSFWGVVARLHLMIRTGKYYNDICHLSEQEKLILDEIGYGNIFSIETWHTINDSNKRDLGLVDRITYDQLVKLSSPLTDFGTMLASYHPNLVFLFSWNDYNLGDLELHEICSEREDMFRAVYHIPEFETELIWTTHPSSFSFKKTNMQEMVEYLYQTTARIIK